AHVSSRTFTSPPPPPLPLSNPVIKDRISRDEMMMADMRCMMREMRAFSSTTERPPTNPPAKNKDNADEDHLD
ncbi:UNVERIFIED_CONTAM: hypothetical protein Sindi_1713700, partial [Sesamum indicum]